MFCQLSSHMAFAFHPTCTLPHTACTHTHTHTHTHTNCLWFVCSRLTKNSRERDSSCHTSQATSEPLLGIHASLCTLIKEDHTWIPLSDSGPCEQVPGQGSQLLHSHNCNNRGSTTPSYQRLSLRTFFMPLFPITWVPS